MKRLRALSLGVAGLLAGGVLLTASIATAATNLVTNPGFESGLSGWACSSGCTQLTFTFTATSGSAQIYLHGWYAQGRYLADDVSLTGPGGTVTVPPTPTGLTVTGTTSSSVSLSWNASAGATGYKVYRGTNVTTVTGTSATISGLNAATTYTFTVSATNAAGESAKSAPLTVSTPGDDPPPPGGSPRSWPYIDITMPTPTLADVARATGQKFFTLAFIIGSSAGCVPSWSGQADLTDARVSREISDLRALG